MTGQAKSIEKVETPQEALSSRRASAPVNQSPGIGSPSMKQATGNQAMQRLLRTVEFEASQPETLSPSESVASSAPDLTRVFGEQPLERIIIHFNPKRPWVFTVEDNPSPAAITTELYGANLAFLLKEAQVFSLSVPTEEYEIVQELLRPSYRTQFHENMRRVLDVDIRLVEGKLLETRIDAEDEATIIGYVAWWAHQKDLRTESNRSYFDAFLARLKEDRWHTDYLLWESDSAPFLDKLYTELEERAGELNTLIAQNSVEFGAYRPLWKLVDETGAPVKGEVKFTINQDLVRRSAQMILDGVEGITSSDDSRVIRDTLVGLPPPEQAAVLREIMRRFDETQWGIFGRYGEAWEGGMVYYLFESLNPDDQARVAEVLKTNDVFSPEILDTLVAGRGLAGRYLPFTTRKAQDAAQFWADLSVKHEGEAKGRAAAFGGGVASLWLPETAGQTFIVLVSAGAANPETGAFAVLSQASPLLGGTLAVVGTGTTAFSTTIAVQEFILEKDVWTGRTLSQEEVLARGLLAASGALMLGASFSSAAQQPSTGQPPPGQFGKPRLVYSGPGGKTAPPVEAPTAVPSGGGGRTVIIARGNTLQVIHVGEPVPVTVPASVPRHLQPVPAPAPLPAAPSPGAVGLTGAAGTSAGLSAGVSPGSQVAPQPEMKKPQAIDPPVVLYLPSVKAKHRALYEKWVRAGVLVHNANYVRPDTGQRDNWKKGLRIGGAMGNNLEVYRQIIEQREELQELRRNPELLLIPDWSRFTPKIGMEVDHVIELQVTEPSQDGIWDDFDNYELLDQPSNGSSGTRLRENITKTRKELVAKTKDQSWMTRKLVFNRVEVDVGSEGQRWELDEIRNGYHILIYEVYVRTGLRK